MKGATVILTAFAVVLGMILGALRRRLDLLHAIAVALGVKP
jgi:hypothetical protein